MQKITAIIPTHNEAHNIAAAIDSVRFCDEVLVVDSFSTDDTVKIATQMDAKIIQRAYEYSASQKNWAIPQATHPWIVLLDADERIDENLKKEILTTIAANNQNFGAFWIKRRNFFMNKEIRFSGWQDDKVIRLFKRDKCRYENKRVHAEILCDEPVGVLNNKLIHFTYKDVFHYLEKWDRYTTWSATDRANRGENPGWFHFVIKPGFRFFKDYFLKLGILDGLVGLQLCCLSSMSVFMRSLKTKQIAMNNLQKGTKE